jgi:hypothetical protein
LNYFKKTQMGTFKVGWLLFLHLADIWARRLYLEANISSSELYFNDVKIDLPGPF